MKTAIPVASFLLIGAGAAGLGAFVPNPFQGSDTLFNVTTDAIAAAGLPVAAGALPYVGGGSGNGQTALVQNTQQHIAPMSRMMNNGGGLCAFPDTSEAAGIVIGLDAVVVVASAETGAGTACNSTDNGLAYNGTNGQQFGNYKDVLALVYGGKDNVTGTVDCNSVKRQAVVNAWGNMFQNSCANPDAACNDATHGGKLWHAYRRDDASGTADVFSSIIGITPATSASSLNGFGASPYCNAMNWDTAAGNANCALGAGKQFIGPGGVPQGFCSVTTTQACVIGSTLASQGCPAGQTCVPDATGHKRPPLGTWGDDPDPSAGALGGERGADVLPTSMQDNDPIRRTCIGGPTNVAARAGEEVCNISGTLGLIIPMPATDFISQIDDPTHPGLKLKQFPVNNCSGNFISGASAQVFTCASRGTGTKHSAQCPNGDSLLANKCQVPIDLPNATSQCVTAKATTPAIKTRLPAVPPDGRAYNLQLRDGSITDANVGYVQEKIPTATAILALDFAGAFVRNHQVQTVPLNLGGCQLADATDQIGCFVHADRCSIGFAGFGGTSWGDRHPGGAVASDNGAMLINKVTPSAFTVSLLGDGPDEYPMARKLYLNSLIGFGHVNITSEELALAQFESNPSVTPVNINTILTNDGFFTLGTSSLTGQDTPFCEDFNQTLVCGIAGNDNACFRNPAGIPNDPSAIPAFASKSTVCGNGVVELFEECDPNAGRCADSTPCSTNGPAPQCADGSSCTLSNADWTCSVPGATVCSTTCRC